MTRKNKLYSIKSAVAAGIDRLRMAKWSFPNDHIKIDIFGDNHGPWIHLYSQANEAINQSNPKDIICMQFDLNVECYEKYDPEADKDGFERSIKKYLPIDEAEWEKKFTPPENNQ